MKRRIAVISLLVFALWACSANEETVSEENAEIKKDTASCEKPNFEEFKSSGLALLMRGLADDMQHVKDVIVKDGVLSDSVKLDYADMKSVDKTDPSVTGEVFDAMADSFLATLEQMKSRQKFSEEDFNLVINSCMTCHQQFCPGPIVRIRKLRI